MQVKWSMSIFFTWFWSMAFTLYNDILGLGGILPQYLPPNGVFIKDSTLRSFISVNRSKCSWKHLNWMINCNEKMYDLSIWFFEIGMTGDEILSVTSTYSGGVPSRSKFSKSSFTRSLSRATNVNVHCCITISGLRNTGASKLPFFDVARAVDSNVLSQAKE